MSFRGLTRVTGDSSAIKSTAFLTSRFFDKLKIVRVFNFSSDRTIFFQSRNGEKKDRAEFPFAIEPVYYPVSGHVASVRGKVLAPPVLSLLRRQLRLYAGLSGR